MSMVHVSRSVLEAAGGGEARMSLSGGGGSSAADAVVKPANRGLSSFGAAKVGCCDGFYSSHTCVQQYHTRDTVYLYRYEAPFVLNVRFEKST